MASEPHGGTKVPSNTTKSACHPLERPLPLQACCLFHTFPSFRVHGLLPRGSRPSVLGITAFHPGVHGLPFWGSRSSVLGFMAFHSGVHGLPPRGSWPSYPGVRDLPPRGSRPSVPGPTAIRPGAHGLPHRGPRPSAPGFMAFYSTSLSLRHHCCMIQF